MSRISGVFAEAVAATVRACQAELSLLDGMRDSFDELESLAEYLCTRGYQAEFRLRARCPADMAIIIKCDWSQMELPGQAAVLCAEFEEFGGYELTLRFSEKDNFWFLDGYIDQPYSRQSLRIHPFAVVVQGYASPSDAQKGCK